MLWTISLVSSVGIIIISIVVVLHVFRELLDILLALAYNYPPRVLSFFPLLGSAVKYKRDPLAFLQECTQRYGGVFTINMAGNRMVLLSDDKALFQYQLAREDTLSLYDAVYDFGFKETLGPENVYSGSAAHRRILRGLSLGKIFIPSVLSSIKSAFFDYIRRDAREKKVEIRKSPNAEEMTKGIKEEGLEGVGVGQHLYFADAFHMMRTVSLDISLRIFIGEGFVEEIQRRLKNNTNKSSFQERFMKYQDLVEDATAKATALPRILCARMLSKVQALRASLVSEIVDILSKCKQTQHEKASADTTSAVSTPTFTDDETESKIMKESCDRATYSTTAYLERLEVEAMRGASNDEKIQCSQSRGNSNDGNRKVGRSSTKEGRRRVAEYIIGLLFAAHKNIAITSAQVMIMLLEHKKFLHIVCEEIDKARKGEERLDQLILKGQLPFLDKCVHETLRLTQHSIGSMRKVRSKKGFQFKTSDGRHLTVPHGYYVGVIHAVIGRGSYFTKPYDFDPNAHFSREESNSKTRPIIFPASIKGDNTEIGTATQNRIEKKQIDPDTHKRHHSLRRSKNKQQRHQCQNWRSSRFAHIPFSGGVHGCPGSIIAPMLVKAIVVEWLCLTNYACEIVENPVPDLNFERATVAQRNGPCTFEFKVHTT
eukprot:jgi/Bigna1/142752/aug1.72_g17460